MAAIPGKEVEIGGTKYILPPINIRMRREFQDFLGKAAGFADGSVTPTNADVLEMGKIVIGALKRNYKDELDLVALEDGLDDVKLLECFVAVMAAGQAGPRPGEGTPGSR